MKTNPLLLQALAHAKELVKYLKLEDTPDVIVENEGRMLSELLLAIYGPKVLPTIDPEAMKRKWLKLLRHR